MKKNSALRIAAALAILVLLTTCFVGGTFAKYVTSGNSSDTARVAKWGVVVTATSNSAFKTTYATTDGTYSAAPFSITNSVNASTAVVAPGTSGNLTAVTITGTPEVACVVTFDATLTLTGWEIGDPATTYMPLVITVNGTNFKLSDYADLAAFKAAVEAKIKGAKYAFAPGTDLSAESYAMAVSWSWAFSVDDATDAKDTALGKLASAPTIALAITTTVTQVD